MRFSTSTLLPLLLILLPLTLSAPTPTDSNPQEDRRHPARNWYDAPGWRLGEHGAGKPHHELGHQLAAAPASSETAQHGRPSSPPHPSASGDSHARHHKKKAILPVLPLGSSDDLARCPKDMMACPVIVVDTVDEDTEWECVAPLEDLYSCGGCSTLGTGSDCTAIPSVLSVGCMRGACQVYSCASGFVPSSNGLSCVPSLIAQL